MNENQINLKKLKISLINNMIIAILTVVACIIMFTGFKFMKGYDPVLESTKLGMFRFFTVDSNIFMGLVVLIFGIEEIKLLKGKIEDISSKMYTLKLVATAAVGLTFLVVFAYLGPISKGGIPSMLMNSNLFLHLIIPVGSILNFVLFERTNKIIFKNVFCSMIPSGIYAIYYVINIVSHMENGKVSPIYDWYWFVQNGVWTIIIVAPLMLVITFMIGLIIWRLNLKKENN